MRYLVIDGELSGTGIRDKYNGGYISPVDIGLNNTITNWISEWLLRYENAHYNEFADKIIVDELDKEGKKIAITMKNQFPEIDFEYFSAARMKSERI